MDALQSIPIKKKSPNIKAFPLTIWKTEPAWPVLMTGVNLELIVAHISEHAESIKDEMCSPRFTYPRVISGLLILTVTCTYPTSAFSFLKEFIITILETPLLVQN